MATIAAPNSLFWGLYVQDYEEKAIIYTTTINGQKSLVLAFRGTSTLASEWLGNLHFMPKDVEFCGEHFSVHRGFYNHFEEMRDQILNLVRDFVAHS
jgi:hypothetical protein